MSTHSSVPQQGLHGALIACPGNPLQHRWPEASQSLPEQQHLRGTWRGGGPEWSLASLGRAVCSLILNLPSTTPLPGAAFCPPLFPFYVLLGDSAHFVPGLLPLRLSLRREVGALEFPSCRIVGIKLPISQTRPCFQPGTCTTR